MGSGKGLDFKHKEVINIKDGKRLRVCTRCYSRFRIWSNYIYNCSRKLIKNELFYRKQRDSNTMEPNKMHR